MQLDHINTIYFIGIGGIGMSALARYFHHRGVRVTGYDRTPTELTRALEAEGMEVHYEADVEGLPADIDLVVYTPAVPGNFAELVALRERGVPVKKRAEVLGIISRGMKCVAIAGTHGKTTTTTLTTHVLREAGVDPSAFLGGIARNFAGNYVAGESDWVVVEADEYDRSFLQLNPNIAVILSMDADHLEIYGDRQNMLDTGFLAFADRLAPRGHLLVQHDLRDHFLDRENNVISFGIGAGDYNAHNIRVENGRFVYDLQTPDKELTALVLNYPGRHNILNATAATVVALLLGGEEKDIRRALQNFQGIARRFEFIIREPGLVMIDDYAHHPTELEAVFSAVRELYPDRRITGIFQPHLYSRTRDFADGFAAAMDKLDQPVLLPVYPAREEPIPGVSSSLIFDRMEHPRRRLLEREELLNSIGNWDNEVVLTVGAGDIDTLVNPLKERLLEAKTKDHG